MLKPFFSRLVDWLLALIVISVAIWFVMTSPVFSLFSAQSELPEVDKNKLRHHVTTLTSAYSVKNAEEDKQLRPIARYIHQEFAKVSQASYQSFGVSTGIVNNVIAHFGPDTQKRVVIGAPYDVTGDFSGADASGVAGLLELAALLAKQKTLPIRIELVAYALADGEYFGTKTMGSFRHAKKLKKEKRDVVLMLSMDSIGYFSQEADSQKYPYAFMRFFYPSTGNYIKISGRPQELLLTRTVKKSLKKIEGLSVEALTAPEIFASIDFSNNKSYWEQGYAALCITDSAKDRNSLYHTKDDLADTLDYENMAKVVQGIGQVIIDVSRPFERQHSTL
jgi:hypothetical protein